ncbi:DUF2004 domain-containing protein [Gryllotalpicola protaetiae]|uniref:DUF2004 domain-containing protein n=1 Tax=Gryllotalpicola protaetiae TaxID=2419771 RepID=A0A387BJ08_9MICO|nr:DUF2004 domain-containing protein [Gryllotalpicola protaetiae]AYG02144.1 DUF2004 domain-containing protein [Gryllotalpicola protaetiae]
MSVEHDYFGIVDSTSSGGLYWDDTLEVGDQFVELVLSAEDEDLVSQNSLDLAAAMAQGLEAFDGLAREALVAQLSERQSATTTFIDRQVDSKGEDLQTLLDLMVDNSGDIAIDVLKSLQLLRVVIHPEHTEGDDPFATFDYAIDPDESDELLVVSFGADGDVIDVEDVTE